MDSFNKIVDNFVERVKESIQSRYKTEISEAELNYKKTISSYSSIGCSAAVSEWGFELTPSNNVVLPELMRYGQIQIPQNVKTDADNSIQTLMNLPLLLPSRDVNAVLFDMGNTASKTPNVFQDILLRMLFSIRLDAIKASVIDRDLGNDFPLVGAIKNKMFIKKVTSSSDEIQSLIYELNQETKKTNQDILSRYACIEDYNSENKFSPHPYHFVFIDDFPRGFTLQTVSDLANLISNGNAAKAGIKIFINHTTNEETFSDTPRDFNIDLIKHKCSCIERIDEELFQFNNWGYNKTVKCLFRFDNTERRQWSIFADALNDVKPTEKTYTLDLWVNKMISSNNIWKESTINGIKVPVGFIDSTHTFDFYIGNDNDPLCQDFFALVAGNPKSGKSTMLDNIIVNSALKYSPEELEMYLADFADGVSFSKYRRLPHVKALMLANNREYALRMMDRLRSIATERAEKYKEAELKHGRQVASVSAYREATGETMPRILFIIDEFHYLFNKSDEYTSDDKKKLGDSLRQWRKYGICVIFSTQHIEGVDFGNAESLITYRVAFVMANSKPIIRNDAAIHIKPRQAIMNNAPDGAPSANILFQNAWTPKYVEYVNMLAEKYKKEKNCEPSTLICDSSLFTSLDDNLELINILNAGTSIANANLCYLYVGKPDLLRREHTRIRLRRQLYSNILILGDDFRSLIRLTVLMNVQIQKYSHKDSRFYFIDNFNAGDEMLGQLDTLDNLIENCTVSKQQQMKEIIDELWDEMQRRKEEQRNGQSTESRIVLSMLNTQNAYELQQVEGKYGSKEHSATSKKISDIIKYGAPLGIHCIVHGLNKSSLFGRDTALETDTSEYFENIVFLQGAADDYTGLRVSRRQMPMATQGRAVVVNARLDNENYEQCAIYNLIGSKINEKTRKVLSLYFRQ